MSRLDRSFQPLDVRVFHKKFSSFDSIELVLDYSKLNNDRTLYEFKYLFRLDIIYSPIQLFMNCQSNYINKLEETRELNTSDDSGTNREKKAPPPDIMVQPT
jgi:hypothetical protein